MHVRCKKQYTTSAAYSESYTAQSADHTYEFKMPSASGSLGALGTSICNAVIAVVRCI